MADFMAFGRGTLDITKRCCSSLDKKDTASFLAAQQKAVQEDRIRQRLASPSAGSGGKSQQGGAQSALDRMRAMAGLK